MEIDNHLKILLDTYDLNYIYNKFIFLSILTTTVRESFYWLLLYFTEVIKNKPELIKKLAGILIGLIGFSTPLEKIFNSSKAHIIEQLKIANNNFFNQRIINMDKKELLNFDLVEYYSILEHFNENLDQYLLNIKNKYDIPIRCVTLVIVALNKNFNLLIILFIIYFIIVKGLNEEKLKEEIVLTKKYFKYETIIRNYIIYSKNFLVNDEFNETYLSDNLYNFERINKLIAESNNILDMKINIIMFIFICIVLKNRLRELNQYDFLYYFLIIYDIEFIGDKVTEYYKKKVIHNKMNERLVLLYGNTISTSIKNNNINIPIIPITQIVINKIYNKKPTLISNKTIIIEPNDHILINGESGSGKTTLLYLIKGIVQADVLDITPSIDLINSQTYLTLPNHKGLVSGKLFDIITNYDKNPDIDLINYTLINSKINNKLKDNNFINIETLSSGERIRLLIARIIYTIKNKNYNILLFDEIDENLNDELAYEICTNLRNVFKDKIILYITHNNAVKTLFNKVLFLKDGIIHQ